MSSEEIRSVQSEALDLFISKNADYGNAYKMYGPVGIIIRLGDKINRLANIQRTQVQFVHTETLRDTLIDLHNYAAMAVAELDDESDISSTPEDPVTHRCRAAARRPDAARPTKLPPVRPSTADPASAAWQKA